MDKIDITKIENQFPSLKTATDFVDKLKVVDLLNISLDDLNNMIDKVFKMIPFATGSIPIGTTIFRARVNENDKGFENISDLGMKPKQKGNDYGRANLPNEAVFYCADNFELACGEVLQNLKYSFNPKGEIGITTVSEWKTLKDLHISQFIIVKQ